MIKHVGRATVAVFAVLLTSAGAQAAGDGVQLGPVKASPSLSLSETFTNNVFLVNGSADSDLVTTITPALSLSLPVRRFLLELRGQIDWVAYRDYSDEDAINWKVDGSLGADFPSGLSFAVTEVYTQRYLAGSQEFGAGEDSATGSTSAKLSYKIRDAYRAELSWSRDAYLFDSSASRERAEDTLQAALFWRFRPKLSALLAAGWTGYAYDSNEPQDGSARQVNLGLTWDVTSRSNGFAKAGYQWKDYEVTAADLGTESGSYYVVAAGLRHNFTSRTAAEAEASRQSQESDFPQNPYFLRNRLRVGFAQSLSYRFSARIGATFGRDEYPTQTTYTNSFDPEMPTQTGKRTDTTYGGTAGIDYQLLRWLGLSLSGSTERRDSNFDTFDYTVTQVSLSAKAAF